MKEDSAFAAGFIEVSAYLGAAGSVLSCLAVFTTALVFQGRGGEGYSLSNHFISELGRIGVSRGAWLFNAGMMVSGLLFIPYAVGLGLRIRNAAAYLGMAAAAGAGVFCSAVGLFPMNNLGPHIFSAMWFFRLGLATVLFFGIAILAQRRGAARLHKAAAIFSFPAAAAYAAFLIMASVKTPGGLNPLDPGAFSHRPAFWPLAAVEWAVFFTTILWFLGTALLGMTRAASPESRGDPQRR
jgi:hypothetical membrane protein